MLRFLSTLFSSSDDLPSGINDAMIDLAIDRLVEGTDKRLLGLGNYRKQLREPVKIAAAHIIELVDSLPQPVEVSQKTFSSDPRVHAFFISISHLQDKIGNARTIREYMKQAKQHDSDRVYGLLVVEREEVNRMGTVMQDDVIQREVMQTAVNFTNHRYIGPSDSWEETSRSVKKRIFDYMVQMALEKIIEERSTRAVLKQQQILLKRKLTTMQAGNWGLEEMLSKDEHAPSDISSLMAEIENIEAEISKLGASHEQLKRNMQIIKDTMADPVRHIDTRDISMRLSSMNIKADESLSDSATIYTLNLLEIFSAKGEKRILLPCWYPVDELAPEKDFVSDASQYFRSL